jgi:PAS domain S-box-containing protein
MRDKEKSKEELINELAALRESIARLEQELRESQKRFRETVHLLPTVMVEYDLEGLITYVNDYGYELLGYSPADVEEGYRIPWLLPPDEVEKHMDRLGRLIKGEKIPGAEYQLLCKDGSVVDALITSAPIIKDGKVVGIRSTATDIRERKRAEDALKESEGRFRMLVETMRDALGVQDENGIITYVNQRVCELTGYSREELMGRPATDLLEEPDRRVYAEEFAKRRDGTSGIYELTWSGKDGRKILTLTSSVPIFDREGNFKGSFAVLTDITDRKQVNDALRQSEERYRTIVEAQMELVCRFLPDGTLTFVNEAICQLLGQKREQIIGQNFYEYVHPDDQEKTRENIKALSRENPLGINEKRVILPNGKMRWWQWSNRALFDDQGKVTEFQAVGRDITQRLETEQHLQESEERHRIHLESSPDPIVVYDMEGRATYVNPAFENTFGWSSEELLGKPIDFVPEECWPETRAAIDRMKGGERILSFDSKRLTKDGRLLDIQLSSSLFEDRGGNPAGNIVILRDVTDQKLAQEVIRESEEKFRALFDHMPTMAFVIDRNHRLIAGNSAFTEKMGDQFNRTTLELSGVSRPTKEFWYSTEKQVIESGLPTWYTEVVDFRNQGRTFIECRKQPVKDQDGNVTMVVGIANDVTVYVEEQIALTAQLRELRVQMSKEVGPTIIGKSKKISEALGRVRAIAGTDTTVLVTGESGSGKELVAEAIHNLSKRSKKPLIKVNCAALPESIIESELFGHTKGAFTGAVSNRIGRFEAAHGGTIFLDEIGDISPGVQVRLLRVLEERKVERVGDYRPINVDVRIVAATNQNLRSLVEKGRFREDLYYRLNVFNIHLPPLRERTEDIPLLVAHFIKQCSREMGKEISSVSDAAMSSLLQHNWRGNVRELMNTIESACVLCADNTIQREHLPPILETWTISADAAGDKDIREALRLTRGNKAKAARLLGIHRSTLYRRIERYGIATE